jgi:soluble lytic murein transglycosylase-like protein
MALDVRALPEGWNKPTPAIIRAVEQSSREFDVPEDLLYGMIRKETNFRPTLQGYKHGGNSQTFRESWERNKDKVIPGKNASGLTWGDMFPTPESWRPMGLCQLMPFHLVGKTGGIKAGEPLEGMYDVLRQCRIAASYLRALFNKHGSWGEALRIYNGSSAYVRMVASYITEMKGSTVV